MGKYHAMLRMRPLSRLFADYLRKTSGGDSECGKSSWLQQGTQDTAELCELEKNPNVCDAIPMECI
jgi:hypothetical protein